MWYAGILIVVVVVVVVAIKFIAARRDDLRVTVNTNCERNRIIEMCILVQITAGRPLTVDARGGVIGAHHRTSSTRYKVVHYFVHVYTLLGSALERFKVELKEAIYSVYILGACVCV